MLDSWPVLFKVTYLIFTITTAITTNMFVLSQRNALLINKEEHTNMRLLEGGWEAGQQSIDLMNGRHRRFSSPSLSVSCLGRVCVGKEGFPAL